MQLHLCQGASLTVRSSQIATCRRASSGAEIKEEQRLEESRGWKIWKKDKKQLDEWMIEIQTSRMQSGRSTTELHARADKTAFFE